MEKGKLKCLRFYTKIIRNRLPGEGREYIGVKGGISTNKRTIKKDMDLSHIETLSYLLSVLSVSIGGNL